MRDKITDSEWVYAYCRDVKDRPEMRDRITSSHWAYVYCKVIKNRPEMRRKLRNKGDNKYVDSSRRNVKNSL